ncbi:MAG TPA: hypothetical protein VGM80_01880 [Gaiellaceae bacterium]
MPARTDIPDLIVVRRARDMEGRKHEIWVRRGLSSLLVLVPVLALANVFGQRPSTSSTASDAARLTLSAPTTVRGGLIYQARFRITASRDLKKAVLVLGTGWLEGMTLNTIEPSPLGQASADGRLSLELGHIAAGSTYGLYLQFQVDPTNVGRRPQTVELDDGATRLVTERRTITVLP